MGKGGTVGGHVGRSRIPWKGEGSHSSSALLQGWKRVGQLGGCCSTLNNMK